MSEFNPGDIVRCDTGTLLLVHSATDSVRWPLRGWRVVRVVEPGHRGDYRLPELRELGGAGWMVRSCEVVTGLGVSRLRACGAALVVAIVQRARATAGAAAMEASRAPPRVAQGARRA